MENPKSLAVRTIHDAGALFRIYPQLSGAFWIMFVISLSFVLLLFGLSWFLAPVYFVAAVIFIVHNYHVEIVSGRTHGQAVWNTLLVAVAVLFLPVIGLLIAASVMNEVGRKLKADPIPQSPRVR